MNMTTNKTKRYVLAPAGSALLILAAVAAVNAVKPENMIATDGKIEIIDNKHVQELTRVMPFAPGQTLTVKSGNGRIAVSGWDRDELNITAVKQMERRVGGLGWVMNRLNIGFKTTEKFEQYFEEVDVVVWEAANGIEVETARPDRRPNVNVSVLYDIKVPRNTNLNLRTSNGRIQVEAMEGIVVARTSNGRVVYENIDGPVEAKTSNGSVTCLNVNGPIDVHTSNGSVTVEHPGPLAAHETVTCSTSNGSIRLRLADESSFDLRARTSNGRIRSDFNVNTSDGRSTKRELEGFVRNGGAKVDLKTSNGSITISSL